MNSTPQILQITSHSIGKKCELRVLRLCIVNILKKLYNVIREVTPAFVGNVSFDALSRIPHMTSIPEKEDLSSFTPAILSSRITIAVVMLGTNQDNFSPSGTPSFRHSY